MERRQPAGECWYLRYRAGGRDFDLMIIKGVVARIELKGTSKLHTFSGAHIGSSEAGAGGYLQGAARLAASQVRSAKDAR